MKKFLVLSNGIGFNVVTEHATEAEAVEIATEVLQSGNKSVWIYEGLYQLREDFKVKKIPFTSGGRS